VIAGQNSASCFICSIAKDFQADSHLLGYCSRLRSRRIRHLSCLREARVFLPSNSDKDGLILSEFNWTGKNEALSDHFATSINWVLKGAGQYLLCANSDSLKIFAKLFWQPFCGM